MKRLTLLFLGFTLFISLSAQKLNQDKTTGKYVIENSIDLVGFNPKYMYDKSIEWANNNALTILYENDSTYIIKILASFFVNINNRDGWIDHLIIISFKQDLIEFEYTNFAFYSREINQIDFFESKKTFQVNKNELFYQTEINVFESVTSLVEYIIQNQSADDNF